MHSGSGGQHSTPDNLQRGFDELHLKLLYSGFKRLVLLPPLPQLTGSNFPILGHQISMN